jgi:hypothetical protein
LSHAALTVKLATMPSARRVGFSHTSDSAQLG